MINRIKELVNLLNKHNKLYDEGNPILSDTEYDKLYFELVKLEKENNFYLPNSPTQTINYQVITQLEKITHNHSMLSLDKTKDWSEFIHYFGDCSVIGMLKLDGLTCSLTYENGELIRAETRGDGNIGENILHNAKIISNIPQHISYKELLVIDGEVICTYENFKEFEKDYANPRNFAAGSIRLLDAKECASRKLSFVAWNLVSGGSNSHLQNLLLLEDLGFEVTPWTSSFDWDAKEYLIDKAKELGYPIDGLVGRFDDIAYGESLGSTGHHSRAAFAFKFEDETADTTLKDIEWSLGRTGVLTPVAVFNPVDLEGSEVERASLHNLSVMSALLGETPHIGQSIKIFKANMIIPQVKSADTEWPCYVQDLLIDIPISCPVCGGPTIRDTQNESTVLLCANPECEGKLITKLDHYAGKKGLDIKGLSRATLEKLIDWGWVNSITDLHELYPHREEWIKKPGFGIRSVDKILETIETSSHCDLDKFICALGIPLIGSVASKELAKQFETWDNFIDAVKNFKFYELPNFGIEMHNAIKNYNYSEAIGLAGHYITFNIPKVAEENNKNLDGIIFVITGSVKHFKNRDELKKKIENLGGKVTSAVSRNTNYLINNDKNSTSSKNKTAQSLGIPVLTEEDFIETFGITN